jgi:hypothetical protein
MSLKVRIRHNSSPAPRGYRIHPSSFVLSILFHVVAVGGLLLIPHVTVERQRHERPIYEELIQPEAKKIIWYSVPKKPLPEVHAQERIGTFPKPRAAVKSEIAIIARAW